MSKRVMRLAGGLGNQMFQYATSIQIKKIYPKDTLIYDDIPLRLIGFNLELKKIFSIEINCIDKYYDIGEIMKSINALDCWSQYGYLSATEMFKSDRLASYMGNLSFGEIIKVYNENGLNFNVINDKKLKHTFKGLEEEIKREKAIIENEESSNIKTDTLYYKYARIVFNPNVRRQFIEDLISMRRPSLCGYAPMERLYSEGDTYYNIYGNPNDCENIREDLLKAFKFKEFDTSENISLSSEIEKIESVAIHARVKNFYYGMEGQAKRGYFTKAVNYIKKKVENPTFYVFSDDINWCRNNQSVLGLMKDDKVVFVDNNQGEDSYRDMQLMSLCKHIIIPNSTFSWWAGYLNQNPDKIFIAPYGTLPGTINM